MRNPRIKKCMTLTEETNNLIKKMAAERDINENALVDIIVKEYAAASGFIEQSDTGGLPAGKAGGICQTKNSGATVTGNAELLEITKMLKIILTALREVEDNTYVSKDALNMILAYLHPESENVKYKSSDTKLNLANRQNLHPYITASLENLSERKKREQLK